MTIDEVKKAKKENLLVKMFGLYYRIIGFKNEKVTLIEVTDNALFSVPIDVSPSSLKAVTKN